MATATEVYETFKATDEHLAKFGSLDRPKIGGNFNVDEHVKSVLPITGSRIISAHTYGNSLWGRTAKIVCHTPDGRTVTYFHKAIKNENSAQMIKSDFEGLKAMHNVSPALVPKPYSWGPYIAEPDVYFLLAEFREIGQQPPEPVRFTTRLAEMHKNSISPTGKFGFHMKSMGGPIPQAVDEWSDSWEKLFGRLLGTYLDMDTERNPPWPEIEIVKHLTKIVVIPRLLRPLQSDGRSIKPCLVHGDLWDGNTATDLNTGEPFIFDGISFYAHNEYETGNWRAPRHRLSSRTYLRQYQKNFPKSEPQEDWDARNLLYSLVYNTNAAILYPAMKQREAIYEGMKDLCTRYCKDELDAMMSKIGNASIKKRDTPNFDEEFGEEELEESE